MSNSNEQQNHEREVRQEFSSTANGDTYTHVKQTTESVNNNTTQPKANSYRDGYMQGRVSERRHQEDVLVQRDNENAGRGLLVGILVTSLIGLTLGAVWFVDRTNQEATQATPPVIIPPQPRDPSPEANPAPQKETIIERTRDVLVPVPQQAPSPAPQLQAPSPAPQQNTSTTSNSAQEQPATETTPAQPQETQNNTETITPPQTQEQPSEPEETTSDSSPTSTSTDTPSPAAQ